MSTFDFQRLFAGDLPAPSAKWNGFAPYNFVGGHNDPDAIPIDALVASAKKAIRERGQVLATYNMDGGPLGDIGLRTAIADKLKRDRGINRSADEVLIGSGSNHVLELLCAAFINPGDVVLAEQHSYFGMLSRMRAQGAQVLPVALDEHGLRSDDLSDILARQKNAGKLPKFIFTIPTVQNPTSSVMPATRRREILDITREYGVPIIEDECYADLLWEGSRPQAMSAMDGSDHVIHVGSFSKFLSPSLRLGHVSAPWSLLSQLLALKNDGGTNGLAQLVAAEFLRDHYDTHIATLNPRLKAKSERLGKRVREAFGNSVQFEQPPGGIYLWLRFPDSVNTTELTLAAQAQGIAINPGAQWSVRDDDGIHLIRLCFANASDAVIDEGPAKLAEVANNLPGLAKAA